MRLSLSTILKAALGASLALNLVLGGLLWWRPPSTSPGIGRMQARIERILPEPDRPAFRQAMEAGRSRYEPTLKALSESQGAVHAALEREPFDPNVLRAAMAASRARWGEFSRLFEEVLAEGLSGVSPEGRRLIAEDMARQDHGRRGKGGRN